MSVEAQIAQILEKLERLRRAGIRYTHFRPGGEHYGYELGAPLAQAEVEQFESQHGITLPIDYREFLLRVGNGGAGPYYGLYPLTTQMGRYFTDLPPYSSDTYPERLRQPFPLTRDLIMYKECGEGTTFNQWVRRMGDDDFQRRAIECEDRLSSPIYSHGTLELCDYGCGILLFLVVCGTEYGHIWVDDRTNGEGIFPLWTNPYDPQRVSFTVWYNAWLDHQLDELAQGQLSMQPYHYWPNYWWAEMSNLPPTPEHGFIGLLPSDPRS